MRYIIMVGEADPTTTVDDARAMHERIPRSQLIVIPSAAHLSNVEQPGTFNQALLEFLKGV